MRRRLDQHAHDRDLERSSAHPQTSRTYISRTGNSTQHERSRTRARLGGRHVSCRWDAHSRLRALSSVVQAGGSLPSHQATMLCFDAAATTSAEPASEQARVVAHAQLLPELLLAGAQHVDLAQRVDRLASRTAVQPCSRSRREVVGRIRLKDSHVRSHAYAFVDRHACSERAGASVG